MATMAPGIRTRSLERLPARRKGAHRQTQLVLMLVACRLIARAGFEKGAALANGSGAAP